MDWNSARHNLALGIAVTRESWSDADYVDAMFCPASHTDPTVNRSHYPYDDGAGNWYRLVKYTDNGISDGESYQPTDDDHAANDWQRA